MALSKRIVHTPGERLVLALDYYLAQKKVEIAGRPWRVGTGEAPDEMIPDPPWDWLCLALETAADLLEATLPMPVRQLLASILDSVPAEGQGAIRQAHARRLIKVPWSHLLELDCHTVAELLRVVVKGLREQERAGNQRLEHLNHQLTEAWKELQRRATEQEYPVGDVLDELMDRRETIPFVFEGKEYHFAPEQSKLLYILSHDEDGGERTEEQYVGMVLKLLYQGRLPTGEQLRGRKKYYAAKLRNRLHVLQKSTNEALDREHLPLEIRRPRNNYLMLIKKRITRRLRGS